MSAMRRRRAILSHTSLIYYCIVVDQPYCLAAAVSPPYFLVSCLPECHYKGVPEGVGPI